MKKILEGPISVLSPSISPKNTYTTPTVTENRMIEQLN